MNGWTIFITIIKLDLTSIFFFKLGKTLAEVMETHYLNVESLIHMQVHNHLMPPGSGKIAILDLAN